MGGLRYNLKLGEVSEWFKVPLSKSVWGCAEQCFPVTHSPISYLRWSTIKGYYTVW